MIIFHKKKMELTLSMIKSEHNLIKAEVKVRA